MSASTTTNPVLDLAAAVAAASGEGVKLTEAEVTKQREQDAETLQAAAEQFSTAGVTFGVVILACFKRATIDRGQKPAAFFTWAEEVTKTASSTLRWAMQAARVAEDNPDLIGIGKDRLATLEKLPAEKRERVLQKAGGEKVSLAKLRETVNKALATPAAVRAADERKQKVIDAKGRKVRDDFRKQVLKTNPTTEDLCKAVLWGLETHREQGDLVIDAVQLLIKEVQKEQKAAKTAATRQRNRKAAA